MQILFKNSFTTALDNILDYISEDSINQALIFNSELYKRIQDIPHMPYKCRKSIRYNDDNIRDMIFKGYTTTYLVDKNQIIILGIVKYKKYF
jgi:toxin ParE1/3/4